ncbi:MAG TPA: hypothetical protein VKT49_03275 [Bryobacteraceae bacterium]|nr:hypothetical protein [Bryobacteraceae bacterium]
MKRRSSVAARQLVILCIAVGSLAAQTSFAPTAPLPPEIVLLARIKQHAVETLTKQPNYTCVESIERGRRNRQALDFRIDDNLRFEVAWIDGKELFAPPGAKRFDEKDIRELVPTGAVSSGDFALHAHTVFASTVPTYEARGEEKLGPRAAVRYDYRVPRLFSGYSIRIRSAEAVVGYHGSFWVDPVSLDLERLDVIPDELPPELGLRSAFQRIEYARFPIGGTDFLLPASSEMALIHTDGSATRNRVQFTSCREYAGRSVVRFDDPQ